MIKYETNYNFRAARDSFLEVLSMPMDVFENSKSNPSLTKTWQHATSHNVPHWINSRTNFKFTWASWNYQQARAPSPATQN